MGKEKKKNERGSNGEYRKVSFVIHPHHDMKLAFFTQGNSIFSLYSPVDCPCSMSQRVAYYTKVWWCFDCGRFGNKHECSPVGSDPAGQVGSGRVRVTLPDP